MRHEDLLERYVGRLRTAVAGMAVAVGLLLLFRIPLVASFRAALIVLATVELLAFGATAVSRAIGVRDVLAIGVKLLVLAGAYVALSQ